MASMRITGGKGVKFTFDNGITISIQIGPGNYGDNYDEPFSLDRSPDYRLPPSSKAEIACWVNGGGMASFDYDTVKGYVPVEDVLRFVEHLRSLPSDLETSELELSISTFDWREEVAA